MRLRELQLIRFGNFSDLTLEFAEDGKCFHVIYGNNEAGKSTALRAISGLLFGIPERTQDAYLHAPRELRIGAELENGEGARLVVVRRKGRKGTLLDVDERPLAESQLEPYLGGVSRELFEAMFGMDHERLIAGGRELLEGKGEVGEALFGAAAGLRGLHGLVESLQSEAAEIFKPGGQRPRLNEALAQHREARARVKDLSLRAADWERVKRERDEAREQLRRVREEHATNKAALEERQTLQAVLPDLRERRSILARREGMGDVAILADDARDRRQEAQSALKSADLRARKLEDEKSRVEGELATLQVPERLLALEGRAADLSDRRAVFVKASRDRLDLVSKVDAGNAEVRACVRELPLARAVEELESLRIDAASQVRIRELARKGERYQASLDTLRKAAQSAARRMDEAQATLEALPPDRDATALRSAAEAARRAGDVEASRRRVTTELASKQEQAEQETRALPLWEGPVDAAVALPVPADETVDRFEQRLGEIQEKRRALEDRDRTTKSELEELSQELADLESHGKIPSPDNVATARQGRDGLWVRVRGVWLGGIVDASPPSALAGDYEEAVSHADDLGDRIFAEHERVARIAALCTLKNRKAQSADLLHKQRLELERIESELVGAWNDTWAPCGIQPASPREMRSWKQQHRNVLGCIREIGTLKVEAETLGTSIEEHRNACLSALVGVEAPGVDPNANLAVTLETAEQMIKEIDNARQQRVLLKESVETARREKERCDQELRETEQSLNEWCQRWSEAIAPLDLAKTAQPAEAEAVLDKLDSIFKKLAQLGGYHDRIRHIDDDNAEFVSALDGMIRDGCPELPEMPPADRAADLLVRLQKGRDDRTKRDAKQERLEEMEAELQGTCRDREAAEAALDSLMKSAAASAVEDLEAAEQQSVEAQRLDERLREIEERLGRTGRTLDDLVAQQDRVSDRDLILEIERFEEAVEENDRQRDVWSEKLTNLQRDFEEMDGSAVAAEAGAQAEAVLAEIAYFAVEYARKRIAGVLLNREIQRFAEENQGPILSRTSEFFRRMTLDKYSGIMSGFSEDDETIILCLRSSGEQVGVEGLSDGTRDQLYLSLRLAALEHHMEHNEPMPLIVDDVLMAFDDPRSAATLGMMGELAMKNQVLFFTHHRRLVELARQVIPMDRLAIHDLDRP